MIKHIFFTYFVKPCRLWVVNLHLISGSILFMKTGIACLIHFLANSRFDLLICMLKTLSNRSRYLFMFDLPSTLVYILLHTAVSDTISSMSYVINHLVFFPSHAKMSSHAKVFLFRVSYTVRRSTCLVFYKASTHYKCPLLLCLLPSPHVISPCLHTILTELAAKPG